MKFRALFSSLTFRCNYLCAHRSFFLRFSLQVFVLVSHLVNTNSNIIIPSMVRLAFAVRLLCRQNKERIFAISANGVLSLDIHVSGRQSTDLLSKSS
jgi:hypothetical protein